VQLFKVHDGGLPRVSRVAAVASRQKVAWRDAIGG